MGLLEEVKKIEVPEEKNPDWYYHHFHFLDEKFKNMLDEGLKCRKLLGQKSSGNNGHYYISLIKDLGEDSLNSGFDGFMRVCTSFIISDIHPIKCSVKMQSLYHLFAWSRIPLRGSGFIDEFQAYKTITPDKFIGIQCPLYNWISEALDERYITDYTTDLASLRDIIKIMRAYGKELPIYDYSRRSANEVHLIDSDAYLDVCDNWIDDVQKLSKRRFK